jgi:transcription initiation factor TFIIA large subunit
VIEDVVTNVRDAFLDEGVDEQVLQELKQIWTNKLLASKAVEVTPEPLAPQSQPALLANNPKVSESFIGFKLNVTTATTKTRLRR